jgi:hypothetical protein
MAKLHGDGAKLLRRWVAKLNGDGWLRWLRRWVAKLDGDGWLTCYGDGWLSCTEIGG